MTAVVSCALIVTGMALMPEERIRIEMWCMAGQTAAGRLSFGLL